MSHLQLIEVGDANAWLETITTYGGYLLKFNTQQTHNSNTECDYYFNRAIALGPLYNTVFKMRQNKLLISTLTGSLTVKD